MDIHQYPVYPMNVPYNGVGTYAVDPYDGVKYEICVVRMHDTGELKVITRDTRGVPAYHKVHMYGMDEYPNVFAEQVDELIQHLPDPL